MAKVLWCEEVDVQMGPDDAGFLAIVRTVCKKPTVDGTDYCAAHQKRPVWPVEVS